MIIRVDLIQTVGIAVIMFLIGNLIVNKTKFLKKYCIPPAVVGGLVFTLVHLAGVQTGIFSFSGRGSRQGRERSAYRLFKIPSQS